MIIPSVGLYGTSARVSYPEQERPVKTEPAEAPSKSLTAEYSTMEATGVERNIIPDMVPKYERAVYQGNDAADLQKELNKEEPDFAAITLMKNSFPDPEMFKEQRIERYSLDTMEKEAPETQSPVAEPQSTVSVAPREVTAEPSETTPVKPQDTIMRKLNDTARVVSENSFEPRIQQADYQLAERVGENATTQMEERFDSNEMPGTQMTPKQMVGYEEYVKTQRPQDASVMSAAAQYAAA